MKIDDISHFGVNTKIVKNKKVTLCPSPGGDGAEVIYALRNDDVLPNLILKEIEKTGQNARKVYQRRLPSNTAKDYYFIHRETGKTQPVIVEYGFLDSTGDDVSQLKNDSLKYAEAVVKALTEYLDIPYDKGPSEYYVVKKGDTLYSIASKNNTTVTKIKELNDLTSNNLSVGQKLILPGSTVTEVSDFYIVKSGDSLYSIAAKNNTTVNEINKLNNLTSNTLSIGQKLILPSTSTKEDDNYYIVKSGDSLYSIAVKNGTTVNEIKKLNNLTSNTLSIGQKLLLTAPTYENYYTVKSGDSLYSIAKRNNTTVDEIKKLNKLSSNLLSIGQKLILPN